MSFGENETPPVFGDMRDGVLYLLTSMLSEMGMDAASIQTWLNEPNRYLYGKTPSDEIAVGKFESVLNAVRVLEEGSFGLNPGDD